MTRTSREIRKIPAGIWVLGFVSMLMDISSEMIHSLLPLFMVSTLGATAFVVGVVEGLAESTALIVKVFSGALSDYLGKRKGLAVFGYALGALSKPLFAIAPTMGVVLTARFLDRVGKGVRGAPRDALVAAAKAIVEHVDRALDLKYADRAHQLRLAAGKDSCADLSTHTPTWQRNSPPWRCHGRLPRCPWRGAS